MNIKKTILLNIKKGLTLKDRIILSLLKRYSFKIYKMGFIDGYNFKKPRG